MRTATTFILFLLVAVGAAAAADGPYVLRNNAGSWEAVSVERVGSEDRKQTVPLARDASVTVKAVGAVPAFKVRLREPAKPPPDEIRVAATSPMFVLADTHGEYEILVSMLQKHGVLGKKLEWEFARGHLVLLGDVFDRGPNQTEILWLIYKLEAEAARAGGGVHLVLGNHEAMVMMGDLRYLHPKYLQTTRILGVDAYSRLFDTTSVLGQWLRTMPTVLKINELLCVHAGISRALAESQMSLGEINSGVRAVLGGSHGDAWPARDSLLMGNLGPLWYRGYFAEQTSFPTASAGDVDRVLDIFGAHRILIGHTIVPAVTPLYGGKVIAVQVPPRRDESGQPEFEGLLIERGELWRVKLDGSRAAL